MALPRDARRDVSSDRRRERVVSHGDVDLDARPRLADLRNDRLLLATNST